MKTIMNLMAVVIILAVAALLVMGAYYGATYLWALFMQLEFFVRVVLSTGVMAALLSAGIIAAGLRVAARLSAKGRLFEARHELYAYVIDLYRRYVGHPKAVSDAERNEILAELEQVESDIILLAGGSSLQTHYELQKAMKDGINKKGRLTDLFMQLIKNFRRDLGHTYTYEESKLEDVLEAVNREKQPNEGRTEHAAGVAIDLG